MSRLTRWSLNAAYAVALVLASPAILWAAWRSDKHREGYAEKLLGRAPERPRTPDEPHRPCVWLHAVSVGEVNLLGVLLAELRRRRPDCEFVVSTTTKTGHDLALSRYAGEHTVFYCPLDFSWAVEAAVRRVRPDLLLLAELELWPNLIDAVRRVGGSEGQGGRVAVFNGRLSENSYRGYRRVRPLVERVLGEIDLVAAQDEATRERFVALGAKPRAARVTGSLKYDGARTDRSNPRTAALAPLTGWGGSETVWLAGSTQAPEESIVLRVFEEVHADRPELRLILVPRHPERFDEVALLLDESGLAWRRRSECDRAPDGPGPAVLLVDTVGELGAWWGVADLGFVGGSFGDRGGQNMIEPAAYGVATCFGPNTRNFRDIVAALTAADGARVVADEEALETFVRGCLALPEEARALGERAQEFVRSQFGATARTADLIDPLIGAPVAARGQAA